MNINELSSKYNVRELTPEDVETVYGLSIGNPLFISTVRPAFAKGNPQSEAFWTKNGFRKTGVAAEYENYTAVIMHREL